MLSKLVDRFATDQYCVGKPVLDSAAPFEDEDDDENERQK